MSKFRHTYNVLFKKSVLLFVLLYFYKILKPVNLIINRLIFSLSWEQRDSNPRPPACKAGALNQLSYAPEISCQLLVVSCWLFSKRCKYSFVFIICKNIAVIFIFLSDLNIENQNINQSCKIFCTYALCTMHYALFQIASATTKLLPPMKIIS